MRSGWCVNELKEERLNLTPLLDKIIDHVPSPDVEFYTGILDITANTDGLASVMGHEIAHAVAKHSLERASQALAINLGTTILDSTVIFLVPSNFKSFVSLPVSTILPERFLNRKKIPIYADNITLDTLKTSFSYLFIKSSSHGYEPILNANILDREHIEIDGFKIEVIKQNHGNIDSYF